MAIQPVGQPAFVEPRYDVAPVAALVGPGGDDRRIWLMNHAAWGAILAGVVCALLVQMLLSLLGVGVGLASFSISGSDAANPGADAVAVNAGIWWVVSGLIASFVGGVVAGRLSGSARPSTAAWHGFVAWCATTLVVVWLLGTALGTALGGVLGGTVSAIGSTVSGVGHAAGASVSGTAAAAGPDALQAQVRSLVNPNDPQTVQAAIVAYVRASIDGDKAAADAARQQAVDSLARVANISPEEAQNRLNQLQQKSQQAAQQAREAAETARKAAARGALFAFAALLLGGIASIVGGGLGTPRRSL